jgi:hypothetical protein
MWDQYSPQGPSRTAPEFAAGAEAVVGPNEDLGGGQLGPAPPPASPGLSGALIHRGRPPRPGGVGLFFRLEPQPVDPLSVPRDDLPLIVSVHVMGCAVGEQVED